MKTLVQPISHTLQTSGATITYDVRAGAPTSAPPLFIIGSPMGADGFVSLAGYFADRTILTYDPRGVGRSSKDDPLSQSTPDQHAEDLHRVITDFGGPVDLMATSGGAINALALVAEHPDDVRTLVAHEPPIATVLPDGDTIIAANRDIRDTYMKSGFGPGMAKFIGLVMQEGEIPADYLDRPAPDPVMFGLPTQDDGSRADPLLNQNMLSASAYQLSADALQTASTRIVMGVGEESAKGIPGRAAIAIAERLSLDPVFFPAGHDGFLGGEYGRTGKPDEFAAKLREVLG